jgi:hypothetical protein
MITFHRSDGCDFQLREQFLSQQIPDTRYQIPDTRYQIPDTSYPWRQVKRMQIAKVFRSKPKYDFYRTGHLDAFFGRRTRPLTQWKMIVFNVPGRRSHMQIGCESFSAKETAIIKKWALAK